MNEISKREIELSSYIKKGKKTRCYVLGLSLVLSVFLQSCVGTTSNPIYASDGLVSSSGNSNTMNSLMDKADAAYNAGHWNSAVIHYESILSNIPQDSYAWFRLGNALTRLGQVNQAIYAYETSLSHDSAQFKPWFNLSTTHLLGAKIATLNSLRSISASDPSRAMALSRLETLNLLLQ